MQETNRKKENKTKQKKSNKAKPNQTANPSRAAIRAGINHVAKKQIPTKTKTK